MTSLARNITWLGIGQGAKVFCQLLSLLVLSRLLPPSAHGILAMAGVTMALLGLLRDFGTGAAIIQRNSLTEALASTVFWFNFSLCVFLGVVLALFSETIANFFGEPELAVVLIIFAMTFPFYGVSASHIALMERENRFKELALIETSTQLLALMVGILLALSGVGVRSVAYGVLLSSGVGMILVCKKSGWSPRFLWSFQQLRSIWSISANLTGFNAINYLARNADSIIVGRVLGASALGQYSMAYKLMLFPVQNMSWVVGRALLPALSRLKQKPSELVEVYTQVLGAIAMCSAPVMVGMWTLREEFPSTILGSTWSTVSGLLFWLAPVGLLQSFMSTIGSVLTSQGRTDRLFYLGIFNTATVVFGFYVGSSYGVEAVAASYFFANLVNFFVTFFLMSRWLGSGGLFQRSKPALLASIVMCVAIVLSMRGSVGGGIAPVARLLVLTVTGALVYFLALRLLMGKSLLTVFRGWRF